MTTLDLVTWIVTANLLITILFIAKYLRDKLLPDHRLPPASHPPMCPCRKCMHHVSMDDGTPAQPYEPPLHRAQHELARIYGCRPCIAFDVAEAERRFP